jgi:hypothetical protein
LYAAEAAAELLIGHERWLRRSDFVGGFIEVGLDLMCDTPMAFVEWAAVVAALDGRRLPCSGSEEQVLRIAASIAVGARLDLGAALTGLDEDNVVRVAAAVLHAAGHRDLLVRVAGWGGQR